MYYRTNVTVLVSSELVDTFDPDHESIFIAARERGIIVLRPINALVENQCNENSNDYQSGYMMGANDGFQMPTQWPLIKS